MEHKDAYRNESQSMVHLHMETITGLLRWQAPKYRDINCMLLEFKEKNKQKPVPIGINILINMKSIGAPLYFQVLTLHQKASTDVLI